MTARQYQFARRTHSSPAGVRECDIRRWRQGATEKVYVKGTHRTVAPAHTLERLHPFLPAFGITRVANVTGLDRIGVPVVVVCRPNSCSLAVSQGKGLTLDDARASGLMESIELYHAEHITGPVKLASYNDLKASHHRVVKLSGLPRLKARTLHPDLKTLWIEGVDLLKEDQIWLPYELVHTDFTLPLPPGSGCFVNSSNGLASGNHILEAIIHGICEVIERDAIAVWHASGGTLTTATELAKDSVLDAECTDLLDRFERAGVRARLWNVTSDVAVPTFYCVIDDRNGGSERLFSVSGGVGCHATARVALLRALTEAAQTRLTTIAGSRDDIGPQIRMQTRRKAASDQPNDVRNKVKHTSHFKDASSFESDTLEEDLDWILAKLTQAGLDSVIVVNLTQSRFGIPVVRVVIPGLEAPHEIPGYVPGTRAQRARLGEVNSKC